MQKKNILLILLIFLSVPIVFAQRNKTVKDPVSGQPMLYGAISIDALREKPFSEWFDPGYQKYNPDTNTIIRLINNQAPVYHYTIVLGTWCPDSRREVPRMLKVLDETGVPPSNIALYAVNREKKARHTPVKNLDIKAVPTLIISHDNLEIGRIIETPKTTIEGDLLTIIGGE